MAMGDTYDPKYRMKYRPDPLSRLCKYSKPGDVPPMVGDPPGVRNAYTWDERCRALYEDWRIKKLGLAPPERRTGLWMHG